MQYNVDAREQEHLLSYHYSSVISISVFTFYDKIEFIVSASF